MIKADELAAQNYLPGEINSITFYIKNKGNYVWNDLHNFKISMANTKETEITDRKEI